MKEQANITIPRKLKNTVYRKIREDLELREKIEKDTGKKREALYQNAYRDSEKIESIFIIQSFQRHTGWSNAEIYEEDIHEIIDAI